MSEKRTTKALASRIQMDYLHRFQPLKYWKRLTIVAVVMLALLWSLFEFSPGRKEVYSPGPVSQGHKLFEKRCSECHTQNFANVSNDACLKCHQDLGHHQEVAAQQPHCIDCHQEHRNTPLVQTVTASNCAVCHEDLKRTDKQDSKFFKNISALNVGHPEFRFLTSDHPEAAWTPAALKLNHKIHLKPDIEKSDGSRTTLQCRDCHSVDTKADPQGLHRNATFHPLRGQAEAGIIPPGLSSSSVQGLHWDFIPMIFGTQCQSCHALGFDTQFPDSVAPHKKPEEVREFLQKFYRERLAENPNIYLDTLERSRPGPKARKEIFISGEEWLKSKISSAEKDLLGRSCLECHTWKYQEGSLPEVAPVKLPKAALTLGRFDHAAHRGMDCLQCHTQALTSEKTSDQLIPGIKNCLQCHTTQGPGRDSCFECHQYHSEGSLKKF